MTLAILALIAAAFCSIICFGLDIVLYCFRLLACAFNKVRFVGPSRIKDYNKRLVYIFHKQATDFFHALIPVRFPLGYSLVALVEPLLWHGEQALDFAYERTNSYDTEWWTKPSVKAFKKTRSTSVGDCAIFEGRIWLCDEVGWTKLPRTTLGRWFASLKRERKYNQILKAVVEGVERKAA